MSSLKWKGISHHRPATTAQYTYRPDGLRHSKTVNTTTTTANNTTTTTHIWDRGNIIAERNNTGAIINRFYRGLRGQLIHSPQHGFYLHNARGDVIQRVDNQGNIFHTYQYDAFGNEITYDPNNTNPFRFAAEYWDSETQTYYLRARHFNPRTGRFTQPDPFWNIHNMQRNVASILQSGNLFVYTMNNPIRWIDPSGLEARDHEGTGFPLDFMISLALRHGGTVESGIRDYLDFQRNRDRFERGSYAAAQANVINYAFSNATSMTLFSGQNASGNSFIGMELIWNPAVLISFEPYTTGGSAVLTTSADGRVQGVHGFYARPFHSSGFTGPNINDAGLNIINWDWVMIGIDWEGIEWLRLYGDVLSVDAAAGLHIFDFSQGMGLDLGISVFTGGFEATFPGLTVGAHGDILSLGVGLYSQDGRVRIRRAAGLGQGWTIGN